MKSKSVESILSTWRRILASGLFVVASAAAGPVPAAAGGYGVDVVNADLALAVDLLAKSTGRDIVLDGNVPHTNITIAFERKTADDAIRFFAQTQGLVIEHFQNADILVREQDAQKRAPDTLETRVIALHTGTPTSIVTSLQGISNGVSFAPNDGTKMLVLRGPAAQVAALTPVIEALDAPSFGQAQQTKTFEYSSGKPSEAVSAIRSTLGTSTTSDQIIPNDAAGTIVALGSADFLSKVTALLQSYDRYGKQVLYDVRIVELTPVNDSKTLGFNTSSVTNGSTLPAGSFATSFATRSLQIFTQLDAMIAHGTATVISDPQIVAQNNTTQTMNATEQYPIITSSVSNGVTSSAVAYAPIGLILKVTPTISNDGSVLTNIAASYSAILGFSGVYPIIGQRETDGSYRIGNGETLVLSGLMQDSEDNTIQKLPLLGDIPLIGAFFRHQTYTHSKTELVFLMTPHIKGSILKGSDVPLPFAVPSPMAPSLPDHQGIVPGLKI